MHNRSLSLRGLSGQACAIVVRISVVATLLTMLSVVTLPTSASAQVQSSDQQKCIIAINKSADKLAKIVRKQIYGCIKAASRGLLVPGATVGDCISDQSGKVGKALQKTLDKEQKACSEAPDYGYVSGAAANQRTLTAELLLAAQIFGDLDTSILSDTTDRDGAGCQVQVAKAYTKLAAQRVKAFVKCKRDKFKADQVASAADIQSCYDEVEADPKGKIGKAFDKLAATFIKRCGSLPDPLAPFPGACQDAADPLECFNQRTRCSWCLLFRGVDGLDENCELRDDNSLDLSCVDPDANECAGENGGNNCSVNASCTDLSPGFACVCLPGYFGDGVFCDDQDECLTDPCDPNASCTNLEGSFECACLPGWEGDGMSCTDVDECTLETDNCALHATCTNEPGTFSCACDEGYEGDGVTCTDVDECATETDNCDTNATCTNTDGGFTCACNSGYSGDGVTCTDVNECAEETDNCDTNATCTNTDGSFTCECNSGYLGDGVTCNDADECSGEGDGNNCSANATCTNTVGSFTCACNPGYTGDGVTCTDVNECALGTDDCHPTLATCNNTPGGYTCSCNAGFIGDGVTCNDDNECSGEGGGNNCSANAYCTNTYGSFECTCNPGFTGDGVTCTDLNECNGEGSGNNCGANSTCINLPGTFACECNPGYSGDGITCVDIDECALGTDNCDPNATCTNTIGSFTCTCNSGYGGDGVTCTDFNECAGEGGGNNCSVNANCANTPGSFTCDCEDGYFGNPYGTMCEPFVVQLTSPTHGTFTTASSIGVTGQVTADPISSVSLTINGNAVSIAGDGSFSTSIPLSQAAIFNQVRAELTEIATGFTTRDRRVVIAGPSVASGAPASQTVALRLTDTGFNTLEPILTDLVDFDITTLLPVGTQVIGYQCVQDSFLGCLASIDSATVQAVSLGGFGLDVDSMTNFVAGDILLTNIFVDLRVHLTISGIGTTCDHFQVSASTTNIYGDYALEPDGSNPENIDVNQIGGVNVVFGNFNDNVDCGGIGFLTFLVNLAKGNVQQQVHDALVGFLDDPDGSGPQDAPIAQAIEDALGGLEIAGPIGAGLGVDLHTPLFSIPEDVYGVTLASNSQMTPLAPDPSAPTFARTLVIPQTFPFSQLSQQMSPGGHNYGMALALSDTAFNQILAAQVESGLLQAEVSEIDLGTGTQPVTAGLFSLLVPEFGLLPPSTPLLLRITPTLAPVLTGNTGSLGEIAELKMSHLLIDIVSGSPGPETLQMRLAADITSAFDLTATPTGLLPALTAPDAGDILITLLDNPLGADEAQINATVPVLLGPLFPQLSTLLQPIALPEFLGLQPTPVEVGRVGDFMGVYLDVAPAP
jgi:hypothetical protein